MASAPCYNRQYLDMKHGSIATFAERVGTIADSMTIPRWTYGDKLQEAGYTLAAMTGQS